MTELAKKLPSIVAILALAWVMAEALRQGIDSALLVAVVTAIAGLGGFYLQDFVKRRSDR